MMSARLLIIHVRLKSSANDSRIATCAFHCLRIRSTSGTSMSRRCWAETAQITYVRTMVCTRLSVTITRQCGH